MDSGVIPDLSDSSGLPDLSDIVLSINGRDAGKCFVIIAIDNEYVILADGKTRRVEKPKRKKIKHTRLLSRTGSSRVGEKLRQGEKVTNAELRRTIIEYTVSTDVKGGMQVG